MSGKYIIRPRRSRVKRAGKLIAWTALITAIAIAVAVFDNLTQLLLTAVADALFGRLFEHIIAKTLQ